ncbi:hypothetical protein ABT142_29780, partial [Streptomyces sp. NPDC001857]|uniref:hypothetical protein n=1 Tax=Streptomyces sp. NPDC001857 TaxID=3154400 RepID=UPI00331689ED
DLPLSTAEQCQTTTKINKQPRQLRHSAVTLARALAALPNRPHRDTGKALNLIAHRLALPRLASNANDPLRVFLTHTRH